MSSGYAKHAVVLGLLSAVGPFAIDMYLPALPTIAANLHASTAATQMTLMVFFVAFGTCQILYGLAADTAGRKPPLYLGLVLFLLGSVGAIRETRLAGGRKRVSFMPSGTKICSRAKTSSALPEIERTSSPRATKFRSL